jgi:GNAT superfamily N-acetyltransferase
MRLRAGRPADAAACAALIAAFQRELTDDPDGLGAEPYLASVSEQAELGYLASARYVYFVAVEGRGQHESLLGFIALRDRRHLFHLFVARAAQGRGVARRLWDRALDKVRGPDGEPAMTVNSSLRAVPVYRAFGFVETGPVARVHGISFQPMGRAARGSDIPSPTGSEP